MLERLIKQPYLYDEKQIKLIREQLKVAKNELAMRHEIELEKIFVTGRQNLDIQSTKVRIYCVEATKSHNKTIKLIGLINCMKFLIEGGLNN